MATIYKRGNAWYLDYRYHGRRVRKRIGRSKRVAQLALNDIELKLAQDEAGLLPSNISLADWVEAFKQYAKTNTASATAARYAGVVDGFASFAAKKLGSSKLRHISAELIETYKAFRRGKVKPRTLNYEVKVLRLFFNRAIQFGHLRSNPAARVQTVSAAQPSPRFLNKEEIDNLLASSGELYPFVLLLLKTGLRKGEALNLRWEDVDFERQRILVVPRDSWVAKGRRGREVPFDEHVAQVLQSLPRTSEYVLTNRAGGQLKYHLYEKFARVVKRAGLEGVTLHTLRHTYISHLVMAGTDLVAVKQLAGHAGIQTTMAYAHLAPDHLEKAVSKLPY